MYSKLEADILRAALMDYSCRMINEAADLERPLGHPDTFTQQAHLLAKMRIERSETALALIDQLNL